VSLMSKGSPTTRLADSTTVGGVGAAYRTRGKEQSHERGTAGGDGDELSPTWWQLRSHQQGCYRVHRVRSAASHDPGDHRTSRHCADQRPETERDIPTA